MTRTGGLVTTPDAPATNPVLTSRPEQILCHISEGLTNREIGEELGLAEKTVKNAVTDLLAVLGVRRRIDAAVYAVTVRAQSGQPAGPASPDRSRRAG